MSEPLRLLLIEDSQADADLVTYALHDVGFMVETRRVDTADGFRRALDWPPQVVLSDFMLPGFDCLRALAEVRERAPDTPFIVVSGTIGDETAAECMRRGAWDYVLKDNLTRLPLAVVDALERHNLRLEKNRHETELRASQQRFQAIVEHGGQLFVGLDEAGCIRFAAGPAILGWKAEELVGKQLLDEVHAEQAGQLANVLHEASAGSTCGPIVIRCRARDAEWRWIEVRDAHLSSEPGLVLTLRDATSVRQDESALADSEERYRTLFMNSPVALFTHDLEGRFLTANRTLATLLGSEPAALSGRLLADFLQASDGPIWAQYLAQIARERTMRIRIRFMGEGEEAFVLTCQNALHIESGSLPYVLGCGLDLTELERTGQRLNQQVEQLQAMQQVFAYYLRGGDWRGAVAVRSVDRFGVTSLLDDIDARKQRQAVLEHDAVERGKQEMLDRLQGGMLHEFNNLLTAILGFGGLALADLSITSAARSALEDAVRTAEEATRMLAAASSPGATLQTSNGASSNSST